MSFPFIVFYRFLFSIILCITMQKIKKRSDFLPSFPRFQIRNFVLLDRLSPTATELSLPNYSTYRWEGGEETTLYFPVWKWAQTIFPECVLVWAIPIFALMTTTIPLDYYCCVIIYSVFTRSPIFVAFCQTELMFLNNSITTVLKTYSM